MSPRPGLRGVLLAVAATVLALMSVPAVAPAASADVAGNPSGPDVASWQHPNDAGIDWAAVKAAGQSFTFVKATEGTSYTNPYFASDWRASAAAGLLHGAYHFARPGADPASAALQARAFAAAIGNQQQAGTLPPVLDLEQTGGLAPTDLINWTSTFLTTLQGLTGRTPMLYTYPYFWRTAMASSAAFTQYPLWMASYSSTPPPTFAWPTWTFWQYTSSASVRGIPSAGMLDMNQFNGSPAQLGRLALVDTGVFGPPAPAPTPTAPPSEAPPQLSSAVGAGSRYVPITPVRFADTRSGLGVPAGPAGGPVTATVPAVVPADATAVVLDVSVVAPDATGWLRVSPAGSAPTTTALNFTAGQSLTGLAVTATDAQRRVTLTPYGARTHLVADVVGYYAAATGVGGHWTPLPPVRALDSRPGLGTPAGPKTGDVALTLPDSVPTDATGVVLDVSVVDPSGAGFVRLAPAGSPATTTALNYSGAESQTGLAVTRANGRAVTVSVFGAPTHLVVDVVGYYDGHSPAGSGYVAVTPQRFLDTRSGLGGTGPGTGPMTVTLPTSVPASATAVVLDISVVDPHGSGWIRLSAPTASPTTTSLNYLGGRSRTGLAVTAVSGGQVTITVYGAATHLVADLVGYQSAG